jgi:hypothetical protein
MSIVASRLSRRQAPFSRHGSWIALGSCREERACPGPRQRMRLSGQSPWNKAGHPVPGRRSSATFVTCVFSSQHFSSYPASSRGDMPTLCPASITVYTTSDPGHLGIQD